MWTAPPSFEVPPHPKFLTLTSKIIKRLNSPRKRITTTKNVLFQHLPLPTSHLTMSHPSSFCLKALNFLKQAAVPGSKTQEPGRAKRRKRCGDSDKVRRSGRADHGQGPIGLSKCKTSMCTAYSNCWIEFY